MADTFASHDEPRGYSLFIRILHWTMAFIMVTMVIAGILMVNVYNTFNATTGFLYDYHRGMGFVLLILVVVRLLAYRFSTPPSPLPDSMPQKHKNLAVIVHFLLYAALIIHPIFGWYATNAWGVKNIPIFGLFNLPALVEKDRELGNFLLAIHGYVGFFIAGLIVLHIAAALMHLIVKRDGVFQRMTKT